MLRPADRMSGKFGGGIACTVIVACIKKEPLKEYEGIAYIDRDFTTLYAPMRMTFAYINAHMDELKKLYEELEDDTSRQHLRTFLNQRLSGEFELEHVWADNQYFCKDFVPLAGVSCFVDCGAFDGDSYRSFCRNYKESTGKGYAGKAYLLEPSKNTFLRLSDTYSDSEQVVTLECGAWSEKATLHFREDEYEPMSDKIEEEGEIEVQVDKIDNIVSEQDKAGFIKMDIEGSELHALKGAAEVIKRDKPVLAISVYHKKEDLVTIPQFIRFLCPDYKLYLRAHTRWVHDLVLYAIPNAGSL